MRFRMPFTKPMKTKRSFIIHGKYDPRNVKVSELYNLIPKAEIPLETFAKNGITGISPELYQFIMNDAKMRFRKLSTIPVIPECFGVEFIKKFDIVYDKLDKSIRFMALHESDESERFVRELVVIIEQDIKLFLQHHMMVIQFMGDSFQIIHESQIGKSRFINRDGYIVWVS